MMTVYGYSVLGGLLIGLSATLLLLFNGRIAGISGIFWGALTERKDGFWRIAFIGGLPVGAFLFHFLADVSVPQTHGSLFNIIVGGLLVGIGVKLGSGCTSGHGVCGIGRLSLRSLVATCTFMLSGIVTVYVIRHVL